MKEIHQIRNMRDSLTQGAAISPDAVVQVLSLALAVIDRLVRRKARWASVSGDDAVDSEGRLWHRVEGTWELDSAGPPEVAQ